MNTLRRARAIATLIALGWVGIPLLDAGELHKAVEAGNAAEVQRLISKGADVNESDLFGTPLDIAVARGSKQITELLIKAGADIEAETSPNAGNEYPLHLAASNKQSGSMTTLLLRHGARLRVFDARGRTPLIIAASSGSVEVAAVLLAAGADPQGLDGLYHDSPLQYAATAGQIEIAKLLLSKGADVNLRAGPNGDTALHYAVMKERPDMVEFLAKHGANVNAKNNKGLTPYEKTYDLQMHELLIELGAKE